MSLYGDEYFVTESESESIDIINCKKHETEIKKFINKQLKIFFDKEKSKKVNSSDIYDWRNSITKLPKIENEIDYYSTDIPILNLKYDKGIVQSNWDHCLFFEDEFTRYLKTIDDKVTKMFKFGHEDNLGILIYSK